MALDPDQTSRLLAAKLRALTEEDAGPDPERRPADFAGGAALVDGDGRRAWVLLAERPEQGLGPALAWAAQRGVGRLEVVADEGTGTLARRAALFDVDVRVRRVDGRRLVGVAPAAAPVPVPPRPEALAAAMALVEAGAEVVVEHGVVRGEVLGLEVARVVDDPAGDEVRIEVGVGRHDREAFAALHGHRPTGDALAEVVATVRRHRRPGAPAHPLHRLAAPRWLRRWLLDDPGRVGATDLEPVEGTVAVASVQDVVAAHAVGRDAHGRPLVVACSTGIDLDLVPGAADVRHTHAPDARLVLVVPARDDHPVTRRLAAALVDPAEVVPAPEGWR